jgi:hypothetical protein
VAQEVLVKAFPAGKVLYGRGRGYQQFVMTGPYQRKFTAR